MDDPHLGSLSLRELEELQAQLHIAIRARIRAQQEAKLVRQGPGPVRAPNMDLAAERDAWLARRRSGSVNS